MPVIKIDKNDFDTQVLSGYLVKSPPLTKRGMRVSVILFIRCHSNTTVAIEMAETLFCVEG